MRGFVKRYELVIFFALALFLGWSPWWTGGAGFIAGGVSLAGLIVCTVAVSMISPWVLKYVVDDIQRAFAPEKHMDNYQQGRRPDG